MRNRPYYLTLLWWKISNLWTKCLLGMFARLKFCNYQEKSNDVTIFIKFDIHLPLLTSRIFQELICQDSIKISIRSSPKSSRSHSWVILLSDSPESLWNHLSSIHQEVILESHCLVTHQCHQEVNCHFTIIIDLRLEVFPVLFKLYTTWSHCAKEPL